MTVERSVSANLKRQLFKPNRDKDLRYLLTIDHSTFQSPYRFVNGDPREFESLTSNGEVFLTFPFTPDILSDDDQEPQAVITLQNADDRIGATLLALPSDSVTVTLQLILLEDPDTIEYEATNLELIDVEINAIRIEGRLAIRGLANEPCPGRVLTNRISPVLFR